MKDKIDWKIVMTAIIALVILEIYALSQGVNGTLFSLIIAVIAGLAGWTMPQLRVKA